MNQIEIKETLYSKCREWIANRRRKVENVIADILVSLEDETKSSAGDKHETGRAMLQIKREQSGEQLREIGKIENSLSKVAVNVKSETVRLGSLVHTNTNNFYLAISAGELQVDHQKFYAIGIDAPIAKLLLGKKVGDTVRFRESEMTITSIY